MVESMLKVFDCTWEKVAFKVGDCSIILLILEKMSFGNSIDYRGDCYLFDKYYNERKPAYKRYGDSH